MILEEIDGDVRVSLNGKVLAIGDTIEDSEYSLVSVIGVGKATFRVDPSCTIDCKAVEAVVEIAAPVVEKPVVKTAAKAAPEPTPAPEAPAAE